MSVNEDVGQTELIRTWDKEYLLHAELEDFEEPIDFEFELSEVKDAKSCIKGYFVCLKLLAHKLSEAAVAQNVTQLHLLSQDTKALLPIVKDMAADTKTSHAYFQTSEDVLEKVTQHSSWDGVIVSLVSQFFSDTKNFIDGYKNLLGIPFLFKLHDQFLKIREKKLSNHESTASSGLTDTDLPTSSTYSSNESTNEDLSSSSSDSSPLSSRNSPSTIANNNQTNSFEKGLSVCAAITDTEVETEEDNLEESCETANQSTDIESFPSPINKDQSSPTINLSAEENEPMLTSTQKTDEANEEPSTAGEKAALPAEEQPSQKSSQMKPKLVRHSPIPYHKKPRRQPFMLSTDVFLIHGVKRYGAGSWTTILKNYDFPSFRTATHLKDRWRTLKATGVIKEDDGFLVLEEPHNTAFKDFSAKKKAKSDKRIPKIRLTRPSTHNNSSTLDKALFPTTQKDLPTPDPPQDDTSQVTKSKENPQSTASRTTADETRAAASPTDSLPPEPTQGSDAPATKAMSPTTSPRAAKQPTTESGPSNGPSPAKSGTVDSSPGHFDGDVEPNLSIEHVVSLAIWGSGAEQSSTNETGESPGCSSQVKVSVAKRKTPRKAAGTEASKSSPHKKRRLWDVEGEVMTWDEPILEPNFVSRKKAADTFDTIGEMPKRAHKKVAWSDEEVQNLLKGVERYGQGQWSMILDRFKFNNRTAVMLKDKYRNIKKKDDD